jgi:hypothetical protein
MEAFSVRLPKEILLMPEEVDSRKGDGNVMRTELVIRMSDLFRATLSDSCGNEGFIGIAPDASKYHVVAPVDRQIARGLKAWVRPDDETPFGGYSGWHYFCCLTYIAQEQGNDGNHRTRLEKARENGWLIQRWGNGRGFDIRLKEDMD